MELMQLHLIIDTLSCSFSGVLKKEKCQLRLDSYPNYNALSMVPSEAEILLGSMTTKTSRH